MKRSSSRELPALFDAAGLQARQKRHASSEPAHKQQHVGPRSGAPRTGYGLASSGLTRSGSLGSAGGAASSGGGGSAALAGHSRGLPEVTSPPPTRPLNFLAELPLSPFAKAASLAASAGAAPFSRGASAAAAADRQQQQQQQQQLAQRGGATGSGSDSGEEDAEREQGTVLDDQENQQPSSCGVGSSAAVGPATWLFSPVRPRPAAGSRAAPAAGPSSTPASAPRPVPSPLLSPSVFMATPPKEALPAAAAPATERPAAATLTHAPSFGSWLMSACRPPSPPLAPPPPASVDVSDVVANLEGDCRAARKYEGASGPSHLDRLLAEIGDTHYPASLMQWEQEELADSDGERS